MRKGKVLRHRCGIKKKKSKNYSKEKEGQSGNETLKVCLNYGLG
jgi:hypothetical protein